MEILDRGLRHRAEDAVNLVIAHVPADRKIPCPLTVSLAGLLEIAGESSLERLRSRWRVSWITNPVPTIPRAGLAAVNTAERSAQGI